VLHEIGGKPLLAHVIAASTKVVPPEDVVVIIGHEAENVRAAVGSTGVRFALQAQQLGTGHAMMSAREQLAGYDSVLVLSGDVPLIRPETITRVRDAHIAQRAAMTILTARPLDPTGYGRIVRKGPKSAEVKAIVEQKALRGAQAKIGEINSGIYAFSAADLWGNIDKLRTNNAHGEYYLTDLAAALVKARKKVIAVPADDSSEVLGANTIIEMMDLDRTFRTRKVQELMASGVSIFRPETVTIDAEVEVAADTILEPFVQLLGKTRIGGDCRIRSYSVISNSEIAEGATIRPGCIIDESKVATGAIIGPYSHLRPGSDIGENAHVGNFVETKKIKLGKGSKANHLTYLGDAEIGSGVNIGAGTITCNYDGVNKHLTRIGDGVFVGSDSTLVAPVAIGKGAYVAAGSCVTEDVPEDSLAIGRARQTNKEGWARQKRESRAAAKK
jgi:bifunctional UDP-N-acetylglucosamine pyrophosphorylase/glucosamine-1-phosphate N-acetyltransferase